MNKQKNSLPCQPLSIYLRPAVLGTGIGVAVTAILLVLFSLVMTTRDVPHTLVEPMALLSISAGGFFSGFFGAKRSGEKGLPLGAVCGLLLYIVVFLAGVAVTGLPTGFGVCTKLAICVILAAIGGVLGVNTKKKIKF